MAGRMRAILTDGLLAGFIGYLVVVLTVTLSDVLQGRPPFHTAGVLGSLLFYDVADPTVALNPWPGPVLAFNGAHLCVMLLFGAFLAWLTVLAERGSQVWHLRLVALAFVLLPAVGLPLLLPAAVTSGVSPWVVALATPLALLAMGGFLWGTHPALRSSLHLQLEP